jgi:cytochrome d ubiquinol oxidase subunit I
MHFFATLMVALGSVFSAVWIVIANSWMQTPAGHRLVLHDGQLRAEVDDFWALICNPSAGPRLLHVVTGAFILGAFFVMSISAWYLLRKKHEEFARRSFTIALVFGTLSCLAAAMSGDLSARVVAEHQPAKLAAFEGHFHSEEGGTPFFLFGIPDEEQERMRLGVSVPGGLSFLVYRDFNKPVQALDQTPKEYRPSVFLPFLCFHIMVGFGTLFIGLTLYALLLRWRGTLFTKRWLLWVFVVMVAAAYLVNQAGWVAAETGRQPWIVYPPHDENGRFDYSQGLLTAKGVSKSISGGQVLTSIGMFGLIYLLLFAVWVYVLNSKIQHGPDELEERPEEKKGGLLEAAGTLAARGGHSLTATDPGDQPARTPEGGLRGAPPTDPQ